MKLLLDFLSLFLFFLTYYITKDIKTATIVCLIAGIIQAGLIWAKYKKLDPIQAFSLGAIVLFGGATIILNNPIYIKWKPTLIYWFMVLLFTFGLIFKKNFIQLVLSNKIKLDPKDWNKITISWSIFFLLLGIINLFIVYNFNDEVWVAFKTFGVMGLMVTFTIFQAIYIHNKKNKKL